MSSAAVVFVVVLALLGIAALILGIAVYSHLSFQRAFNHIRDYHEKQPGKKE